MRVRDLARGGVQRDAFAATMYIKRCGRQLLGEVLKCVREQHSVQGVYAVAVKKTGNNHGTFTMKVVKSVFVLLATRGHCILYSD